MDDSDSDSSSNELSNIDIESYKQNGLDVKLSSSLSKLAERVLAHSSDEEADINTTKCTAKVRPRYSRSAAGGGQYFQSDACLYVAGLPALKKITGKENKPNDSESQESLQSPHPKELEHEHLAPTSPSPSESGHGSEEESHFEIFEYTRVKYASSTKLAKDWKATIKDCRERVKNTTTRLHAPIFDVVQMIKDLPLYNDSITNLPEHFLEIFYGHDHNGTRVVTCTPTFQPDAQNIEISEMFNSKFQLKVTLNADNVTDSDCKEINFSISVHEYFFVPQRSRDNNVMFKHAPWRRNFKCMCVPITDVSPNRIMVDGEYRDESFYKISTKHFELTLLGQKSLVWGIYRRQMSNGSTKLLSWRFSFNGSI